MDTNHHKQQPPFSLSHRRSPSPARIGVFGVAYYKYWAQFEGLLDAMQKKQQLFIEKIN